MLPLKKKGLIASVAALAMAVGGLGIGAGVANAADSTINLTNTVSGHKYDLYKIGNYAGGTVVDTDTTGSNPTYVLTNIAVSKVDDAASTAVSDAATKAGLTVPTGTADAVAWAATLGNGSEDIRSLVNNLDPTALGTPAGTLADGTGNITKTDGTVTLTPGADASVTVSGEGWYVIVESWTDATSGDTTTKPTALVGTAFTSTNPAATVTTIRPADATDDTSDYTLGTANVKPNIVDPDTNTPTVNAEKTFTGSLAQADGSTGEDNVAQFSLTADGPVFDNTIAYTDYTYQFIDTPTSLDIEASADNFTVKVGSKTLTYGTDYKIVTVETEDAAGNPATTADADGTTINKRFAIDMTTFFSTAAVGADVEKANDADMTASGQKITVTYSGTVTGDDASNDFDSVNNNGVYVPGDPGTEVDKKTAVDTVSFKKVGVDADSEKLNDVVFKLIAYKDADGNELPADKQVEVASTKSGAANADGVVLFNSVGSGTYKIEEETPAGYMAAPLLDLQVVVDNANDDDAKTGTVTFSDQGDTKLLNEDAAVNGVADVSVNDNGANATLQNVKSLTQLPLTGAYGIALFIILAVILAGGAAVMVTVSKHNKKAGLAL